jgi:hypothetical protein
VAEWLQTASSEVLGCGNSTDTLSTNTASTPTAPGASCLLPCLHLHCSSPAGPRGHHDSMQLTKYACAAHCCCCCRCIMLLHYYPRNALLRGCMAVVPDQGGHSVCMFEGAQVLGWQSSEADRMPIRCVCVCLGILKCLLYWFQQPMRVTSKMHAWVDSKAGSCCACSPTTAHVAPKLHTASWGCGSQAFVTARQAYRRECLSDQVCGYHGKQTIGVSHDAAHISFCLWTLALVFGTGPAGPS